MWTRSSNNLYMKAKSKICLNNSYSINFFILPRIPPYPSRPTITTCCTISFCNIIAVSSTSPTSNMSLTPTMLTHRCSSFSHVDFTLPVLTALRIFVQHISVRGCRRYHYNIISSNNNKTQASLSSIWKYFFRLF